MWGVSECVCLGVALDSHYVYFCINLPWTLMVTLIHEVSYCGKDEWLAGSNVRQTCARKVWPCGNKFGSFVGSQRLVFCPRGKFGQLIIITLTWLNPTWTNSYHCCWLIQWDNQRQRYPKSRTLIDSAAIRFSLTRPLVSLQQPRYPLPVILPASIFSMFSPTSLVTCTATYLYYRSHPSSRL